MSGVVPAERIEKCIFLLRGHRVMLDRDLAALYEVATRDLNKAVSRNLDRFPIDFMFPLDRQEIENLKFHFGTSSWGGVRKPPRAFTEHGILMLSSVLRSKRAVQVNIQIMRTFTKLRQLLSTHVELRRRIDEMEKRYDQRFKVVFDALRQLMAPPERPRRRIVRHKDWRIRHDLWRRFHAG